MKLKAIAIALSCIVGTSLCHASDNHNYVEAGFGGSKPIYTKDEESDNDSTFIPSINILVGSKLNKSNTLAYELGYLFSRSTREDTIIQTHTAFTGLKLSTNSLSRVSVYLRGGIGRDWSIATTKGELGQDNSKRNNYYAGFGFNFKIEDKSALVLDFRNIRDNKLDDGHLYGVFFSFNQFI